MKDKDRKKIQEARKNVQRERPLVHMIPNMVTAGFCADALAALGARVLMAVAVEEIQEIVTHADALVVNMGQPTNEKGQVATSALEAAARNHVGVVYDPVGMGASEYRRMTNEKLLAIPWDGIIKGNSAEMYTLSSGTLVHEGVDSVKKRNFLCKEERRCMVTTGEEDVIEQTKADGMYQRICIPHKERMYDIVGTGCIAGAMMGAFLAVTDEMTAAAGALSVLAYAYQYANECKHIGLSGYGNFKQGILDGISKCGEVEWLFT